MKCGDRTRCLDIWYAPALEMLAYFSFSSFLFPSLLSASFPFLPLIVSSPLFFPFSFSLFTYSFSFFPSSLSIPFSPLLSPFLFLISSSPSLSPSHSPPFIFHFPLLLLSSLPTSLLLSLSAKDEDFDSAGGLLGSSMKRVKNMAKAGHNRWMCYMILFIVAVFFVCYYIIKWRSN